MNGAPFNNNSRNQCSIKREPYSGTADIATLKPSSATYKGTSNSNSWRGSNSFKREYGGNYNRSFKQGQHQNNNAFSNRANTSYVKKENNLSTEVHVSLYKEALDEEQLTAARSDFETPLIITAGAGSGKTRTMCARIAFMLEQGIHAKNILALTFSKKAATEMKERITSMLRGEDAVFISVKTFHSLCLGMILQNTELLGFEKKNFCVYDKKKQLEVAKEVLRLWQKEQDDKEAKRLFEEADAESEAAKDNKKARPKGKQIASKGGGVDSMENETRDADLLLKWIEKQKASGHSAKDFVGQYQFYFKKYEELMKKQNAVDFIDMIILAVDLLENRPDVLEQYQRRYQYILVDEFQDLNIVQFAILRLLAQKHAHVSIIGDDDQSIYGFRGGTSEVFRYFREAFPNAAERKLQRNYRSTRTVVNAAQAVVAKNVNRQQKTVYSLNEEGEKIRMAAISSAELEVQFVVEDIMRLVDKQMYKYRDIAILCRVRKNILPLFEKELTRQRVPFQRFKKKSLPNRELVRELVSYLSLIVNELDNEAFRKVYNVPKRGLGESVLEYLEDLHKEGAEAKKRRKKAEESNGKKKRKHEEVEAELPLKGADPRDSFSFFTTLRAAITYDFPKTKTGKSVKKNQKEALIQFVELIDELRADAADMYIVDCIQNVLNKVKYEDYLQKKQREMQQLKKAVERKNYLKKLDSGPIDDDSDEENEEMSFMVDFDDANITKLIDAADKFAQDLQKQLDIEELDDAVCSQEDTPKSNKESPRGDEKEQSGSDHSDSDFEDDMDDLDAFMKTRRTENGKKGTASPSHGAKKSKGIGKINTKDPKKYLYILRSFVDDLALRTSEDEVEEEAVDAVTVTTIHQAKGLEWKHVTIVRANEGVCPLKNLEASEEYAEMGKGDNTRSAEEKLEEERRLMYVALSRAQRSLCITYLVDQRSLLPSRFLEEIPGDCVEFITYQSGNNNNTNQPGNQAPLGGNGTTPYTFTISPKLQTSVAQIGGQQMRNPNQPLSTFATPRMNPPPGNAGATISSTSTRPTFQSSNIKNAVNTIGANNTRAGAAPNSNVPRPGPPQPQVKSEFTAPPQQQQQPRNQSQPFQRPTNIGSNNVPQQRPWQQQQRQQQQQQQEATNSNTNNSNRTFSQYNNCNMRPAPVPNALRRPCLPNSTVESEPALPQGPNKATGGPARPTTVPPPMSQFSLFGPSTPNRSQSNPAPTPSTTPAPTSTKATKPAMQPSDIIMLDDFDDIAFDAVEALRTNNNNNNNSKNNDNDNNNKPTAPLTTPTPKLTFSTHSQRANMTNNNNNNRITNNNTSSTKEPNKAVTHHDDDDYGSNNDVPLDDSPYVGGIADSGIFDYDTAVGIPTCDNETNHQPQQQQQQQQQGSPPPPPLPPQSRQAPVSTPESATVRTAASNNDGGSGEGDDNKDEDEENEDDIEVDEEGDALFNAIIAPTIKSPIVKEAAMQAATTSRRKKKILFYEEFDDAMSQHLPQDQLE